MRQAPHNRSVSPCQETTHMAFATIENGSKDLKIVLRPKKSFATFGFMLSSTDHLHLQDMT